MERSIDQLNIEILDQALVGHGPIRTLVIACISPENKIFMN